jgi:hypothetical protein
MNYLCRTKGGYTFVLNTTNDYSKYIGKQNYISLGSDSFRVLQVIDILDSKDVVNLKKDSLEQYRLQE